MTIKAKLLLGVMTPMERSKGRFMRAPDHPTGGEGGGEASSSGDGQAAGNTDSDAGLTTSQKLEKEFGQEITPATDNDDSDSPTGEGGEGAEGDDGDDDDLDGDEGTEGEEADGDDEGEEGDGDSPAEAPKPKSRVQTRIDELTANARQAERDADFWKRRAEELGAKPDSVPGEPSDLPEEPEPSKYQYGEHDLDYIRDRAKYDAKVEVLTEQMSASLKSEAAQLEVKWTTNVAKAVEKYDDFEETVVQGAKDNKWHCPPVISVGIKDSDYGADIAYHLAKNPDEAERISKLSPLEQARQFGRLEEQQHRKAVRAARKAGVGSPAPTPKPAAPTVKVISSAPPPPKRQVRGSGGSARTAADTDDFAAFDRYADGVLGMNKG